MLFNSLKAGVMNCRKHHHKS